MSENREGAAGPGATAGAALLLDCCQAAGLLGVSRRSFWTMHNCGRVPLPVRLSARVVRWRREELLAWTRAGCPGRAKWEEIRENAT